MRRFLPIVMLLALCGAACRESSSGLGDPAALPTATASRRSQDLGDGRVRFWPSSVPVEEGVPYAITVYTHCGLDFLLDFDQSFWRVAADAPPTPAWGNPNDSGVITLTEEHTAVYRSSQGLEVKLARLVGPKDVRLCY